LRSRIIPDNLKTGKGVGEMKINTIRADMTFNEEDGYVGHVHFEVEGHRKPYEITLQSDKRGREWSYSLVFDGEPGSEEEIQALDELLEEDDELFDPLVEAAMAEWRKE
jgi:hypothetical protein